MANPTSMFKKLESGEEVLWVLDKALTYRQ